MVNLISHACLIPVYSLKGKKEYPKLQSLLFSVFNDFFKKVLQGYSANNGGQVLTKSIQEPMGQ